MDSTTPSDDETDPFILAEQKRWLDLARLGKEAWNRWAEVELEKDKDERTTIDFSGQEIDVSDFQGFIFPSYTNFKESTFISKVDFSKCKFVAVVLFGGSKFSAYANFSEVEFSELAGFIGAIFSGVAYFPNAKFLNDAEFSASTLHNVWQMDEVKLTGSLIARSAAVIGHAYLTNIDFHTPPDLISTSFSQPPSFIRSTFAYPCSNWFSGKCDVRNGQERFRRLKQLAADNHDHELELRLFALETKSKRFHSLEHANPLHWPGLVLNFAYGWVSDFGQSVLRPLGWLMVTILFALFAFEAMTGLPDILSRGLIDFSGAAKVAAFVNVVPFAGQAVLGREIMTKGLCPMDEGAPEYLDCLTTLYTISAVEGVFGLIFLFLIGLGLRNRFRIK